MEREEFIGKLQLIYVGDKRAIEEIISEYDRLNNIINELEIFIKNNKIDIGIKKDSNYAIPVEYVLDKLKELKENNNV